MKDQKGTIQIIVGLSLALMASFAAIGVAMKDRSAWKERAEKAQSAVAALTATNTDLAQSLANCNRERDSFRAFMQEAKESALKAEAARAKARAEADATRKRSGAFVASLNEELTKVRPAAEQCDAAAALVKEYRRVHQQR